MAQDEDQWVLTLAQLCAEALGKLPLEPGGVVSRVAQRFALVGVAGELKTRFNLTGWDKGDAIEAAVAGFLDWHDRVHGENTKALRT